MKGHLKADCWWKDTPKEQIVHARAAKGKGKKGGKAQTAAP